MINSKILDTSPLVSIIITTYNHSQFIADAIESILNQSYQNLEIIVIDDGSIDNTKEIVKEYRTVTYFYQKNQGLSAARNTGIKKATGEYILFLDADDLLYPDGISLNVKAISYNDDVAFVSGSYKYVDVNKVEEEAISQSIVGNNFQRLILTNYIGMHGTVLYRKKVIEKYLYDTNLKSCEDYDMYLRISKDHKVLHHTELIAKYRRVGNSMSSNIPIMLNSALKVIKNNVKNLLSDKKIKRLYTLSRQRKIELFCSKAIFQLTNNALKIGTKQWFCTFGLILKYRLFVIIKLILKKIKYKTLCIFQFGAAETNLKNDSFKIYVLMYHKIDTPILDPWNLSVTKSNFESQIKFLKKTNSVINTSELLNFLSGKEELKKNHIYITFDDGYEDNALIAAPILEHYQIPTTFFITNHSFSENPSFFWWDILEIIFLHQLIIPPTLKIKINENDVSFNFEEESKLENIDIETLIWKGKNTFNKRTEAYFLIWKLLIDLNHLEQNQIINQLYNWSKVELTQFDTYNIMKKDMLLQLKENKYIEIGGHTKNHVSLSITNKNVQEDEIKKNKIELENILAKEVTTFAYPYGRTSSDAYEIISEIGYKAAFTCVEQPITKNSNSVMLGRYKVMNYGAIELANMLFKAGFKN